MRLRKWTGCCGGAVAAAAACALGFIVLMRLLFGGMCVTTVYGRKPDPSQHYVASLFQVDCGAMTSFNRRVALRSRNAPWWSGRKTTKDWLGDEVFAIHGPRDIRLRWTSPRELVIVVPADARFAGEKPFVTRGRWRDVRVRWVREPAH